MGAIEVELFSGCYGKTLIMRFFPATFNVRFFYPGRGCFSQGNPRSIQGGAFGFWVLKLPRTSTNCGQTNGCPRTN